VQNDITLEELRAMASHAGLNLTEEELQKLLPGVNRSRRQASELRRLISEANEPAGSFTAIEKEKS
jgi:Ca2+-binding EF-hand superfamily protein